MSNHHHKLAKDLVDFHTVVYKIMGLSCVFREDEERERERRGICLFDGFQVF